jgi:dimethylargininase
MLALTHMPSLQIDHGQRTHVSRVPIDHGRAVQQHDEYCRMLRRCGAEVHTLAVNRELPDSVFIEDTAIVLDEIAVIASMGTEARRPELPGIAKELNKYRTLERIEPPAHIEGGDVLRVGRQLLVGVSARTNTAGISALEAIVGRYGYTVMPISLNDCLHLKTACTALPDGRLLVNPAWIKLHSLQDFLVIPIPEGEPWAANILSIGSRVCLAAAHVQTAALLRQRGYAAETIDVSEFAKAEGGITCMSILLNENAPTSFPGSAWEGTVPEAPPPE